MKEFLDAQNVKYVSIFHSLTFKINPIMVQIHNYLTEKENLSLTPLELGELSVFSSAMYDMWPVTVDRYLSKNELK